MAKTDNALATVQELVDALAVCECGHTKDEHVMLVDSTRCAECRCRQHRPVKFEVRRVA